MSLIAVFPAFSQVSVDTSEFQPVDNQPWPGDPGVQFVLDSQRAVWDHILGVGSWTESDFRISLDGPPIEGGNGSLLAVYSAGGGPLVFQYDVSTDMEFDDPDNLDIPQDFHDWVIANQYESSIVVGRATGPAGGYFNPIGFAGYAFQVMGDSGSLEWYLVITAVLDLAAVDANVEAEYLYQQSVATVGDLSGVVFPEPFEVAFAQICTSVEHDAAYTSCMTQAHADMQCRYRKIESRFKHTTGAGIALLGPCILFPPTCIPSAAFLGVTTLCLLNAKADIPLDFQTARDCCCNALICRDGGGGGACQSNSSCNSVGCSVPICGG